MSDVINLGIQITAIDMLSGVAARVRNTIAGLGKEGRKVQEDFDRMSESMAKGLKGIAVGYYALKKALPGVKAAANLQEAMLGVKMQLAGSAEDAKQLNDMLSQVKHTAITVSSDAPFSAEDVVKIENALVRAGLRLEDITGKSGAAFAATALASLTGEAPEMIGKSLATIGAQFKLKGTGYSGFADWLVRVDDAGVSEVPALIQGLRMAGSTAAGLKISAQDAVTALGALAPLADRAGSAYNNFLVAITSKGKELRELGLNFFEEGQFVGMARATAMLKQRFGEIADQEKRMLMVTEIFGEEGARAANTFIDSALGFQEIEQAARDSLSMAEKMSIWGEGLNAAMAKLGGTAKSTLASLFDPILKPMKEFLDLINQAIGKVGALAEKHKMLTTIGAYGTGGLALGAGGYGIYHLLRGASAGSRVLKGIGGIKGLLGGAAGGIVSGAAGIAKGKAVEAATGVTPVFVTNWPSGMSGSAADIAAGVAAGSSGGILKKAGGWLKKIPGAAKLLTAAPLLGGLATGPVGWALLGATVTNYGVEAATGRSLVDRIFGLFGGDNRPGTGPELKNNINMNITIDRDGRTFTETDGMNTTVRAGLRRGRFME